MSCSTASIAVGVRPRSAKRQSAFTDHIVTLHERHDICCQRRIGQQHQKPRQGVPGDEGQRHKNARSAGFLEHQVDDVSVAVNLRTAEFIDLALR